MKVIKYLLLWILVPALLVAFWIVAPILTISNSPLSVIAESYGKNIYKPFTDNEIHKGDVVNTAFRAGENKLGIVAVRFDTFGRINSDSLIFSIKEKGDTNWYYTGKYKVDQFQPNDFFTFGFPIIADSKGKDYIFQLHSVKGKEGDAIALSSIEPVMLSKYQFTKAQLLENKTALIAFAYKKIFYSFSDLGFAASSLPFLLPLLFYILSLFFHRQIFNKKYPLLIYIFTIVLIIYLIFVQLLPGFSSLILLFIWICLIIFNKLESSVSFLYALLLLSITPIMLIFNQQYIAENYAIWVYYFLVIGTVQAIYELKRKPKDQLTYIDLIKKFIGERTYNLISSKLKRI